MNQANIRPYVQWGKEPNVSSYKPRSGQHNISFYHDPRKEKLQIDMDKGVIGAELVGSTANYRESTLYIFGEEAISKFATREKLVLS